MSSLRESSFQEKKKRLEIEREISGEISKEPNEGQKDFSGTPYNGAAHSAVCACDGDQSLITMNKYYI